MVEEGGCLLTKHPVESCANCFYARKAWDEVLCCRYPKGVYGGAAGQRMRPEDWCGEWEKR